MEAWSVTMDFRLGDAAGITAEEFENSLVALLDDLADHSPAGSYGPEGWSTTLAVDADAPLPALDAAIRLVRGAAKRAGLPFVPRSAQVRTMAELERRNQAQEPELVGVAELADLLRVSKQRVAQLVSRDDFPEPLVRLKAGPVWSESSIKRFVEEWPRRAGRPRREATR